jgi:hypothetical protein
MILPCSESSVVMETFPPSSEIDIGIFCIRVLVAGVGILVIASSVRDERFSRGWMYKDWIISDSTIAG